MDVESVYAPKHKESAIFKREVQLEVTQLSIYWKPE